MASAPRQVDDILESMQETFDDIDPTIDITKGPAYVLSYAMALELSRTESQTAYLAQLYQLQNAEDVDNEDIEALGANYGLDPNVGGLSTAVLTFYRETRPEEGQYCIVEEGALAGTDDRRYQFIVLDDVFMNGNSPDIYYDPTNRRYSVKVEVEAISVGDDFNLAAGTVTTIMNGASDFDGVINEEPALGGSDPIDRNQFRDLIWNNLQALDSDLLGRLNAVVADTDVGASDTRVVGSGDMVTFERQAYVEGRTAFDIYTLSDTLGNELQSTTALGGETFIPIEKPPTQSIQYVTVDGVRVPFRYTADTDPAFRGSPRAKDRVQLLIDPLQPGQAVEIKYYNYKGIYKANYALQGRGKPFGNDVLVRLGYAVPVFISGNAVVSSAEDFEFVRSAVQDYTESYLRNPNSPSTTGQRFVDVLYPKSYQDAIIANVPGIGSFNVTNFIRMDTGVQAVSVIEFDGKTEYPVLAPGFIVQNT